MYQPVWSSRASSWTSSQHHAGALPAPAWMTGSGRSGTPGAAAGFAFAIGDSGERTGAHAATSITSAARRASLTGITVPVRFVDRLQQELIDLDTLRGGSRP